MKYIIQVGVRDDSRTYFPSEIIVKTKCRASPMVDPPRFAGSRDASTASLMLGLASEEYGPISHYWLIVVPGNFTPVTKIVFSLLTYLLLCLEAYMTILCSNSFFVLRKWAFYYLTF